MKILKLQPNGYCGGVQKAIDMATNCLKIYKNQKITILGMLVHNRFVVESLENLGIKVLQINNFNYDYAIDSIAEGIVITTAHGIPEIYIHKLEEKGLKVINTTCPYVTKSLQVINDALREKKTILYYGNMHHPESYATTMNAIDKIFLFSSIDEIPFFPASTPLILTSQTTMSYHEVQSIYQTLKLKYPLLELSDEVCSATRLRQEAIYQLPKEIQSIIIVGDPHSNNTNKLFTIAKELKLNAYCVESANEVNLAWFQPDEQIAITSGASTPNEITELIIQKILSKDLLS